MENEDIAPNKYLQLINSRYGQKVASVQLYSCPEIQLYWHDFLPMQTGKELIELKGLQHENFEVVFFHQITPPGSIRDSIEPFSFLVNFHGVMYILKRLPGVWDTGESQTEIMKLENILKHESYEYGMYSQQ